MRLLDLFRQRSKPLLAVLKEYFAHNSRGLKDSTIEKHLYFYQNIERFLKENKLLPLQLHEVRIKHMEQMREWLLDNIGSSKKGRTCTLEHASRHIEHCQKAFDYAVMMEYFTHNPIDTIKCQREEPKEIVSLDNADLQKLIHYNTLSQTTRQVIDLFLFQCFTGLSYIDLWMYEIRQDNGITWITSPRGRGKNNKPYFSEFNPYAKTIHDHYEGKLPYISNQYYNRKLKRIAFSLNINKELTTHSARKTYATLRYKQGHSLESIADQLGNTPDVTRKHYIKKGNDRIRTEIERLKDTPLLAFN